MDVCKYINSKAVREHLRKLNWEFTPLEAAWFVWKWRGPVEERLAAWQEIIDEMPDQEVKAGHYFDGCPSLHEFLRETISIYRKCVERFFDNTDAYYILAMRYADGGRSEKRTSYSFCPIKHDHSGCEDILDLLEDSSVVTFEISKINLDEKNPGTEATFDTDLNMIMLSDDSENWNYIFDMFSSLCFCFPLPFRKGDIVYFINSNDTYDPMVYIDCKYDHISDMDKYRFGRYADNTDMSINVYRTDSHGEPTWDTMWDVTDIDLFDEELALIYVNHYDFNRRLKTYKMILLLSATLTGRLGLEEVFKGYNQLKNDNGRSYLVDELFDKADSLFVRLATEEQKRGYYHAKEIARKYPKAMKVLGEFEESDPYEKT